MVLLEYNLRFLLVYGHLAMTAEALYEAEQNISCTIPFLACGTSGLATCNFRSPWPDLRDDVCPFPWSI